MTCLFFAGEDQYSLHPEHIFCYGDAWTFDNQLFYSDERFGGLVVPVTGYAIFYVTFPICKTLVFAQTMRRET